MGGTYSLVSELCGGSRGDPSRLVSRLITLVSAFSYIIYIFILIDLEKGYLFLFVLLYSYSLRWVIPISEGEMGGRGVRGYPLLVDSRVDSPHLD